MPENDTHKRPTGSARLLKRSHLLVPCSLLALSFLCAAWILSDSTLCPDSESVEAIASTPGPRIVSLPSHRHPLGTYLEIRIDTGEKNDIFYCTVVATATCSPITQSPATSEMWPEPDITGEYIAYYALHQNITDVGLLTLPPTINVAPDTQIPVTITILTEQSGTSGLHVDYQVSPSNAPAFSPDGQWVAFPAQSTDGVDLELFVARIDGRQVRQVTDKGWTVKEYIWVTNNMILMTFQRSNGRLQQWRAILSADDVRLEKLP